MQCLPDISLIPASSAKMGELRNALSYADVIEQAPELRGTDFLNMRHPARDAYVAAKFREAQFAKRPTLDAAHPRQHLAAARAILEKLEAEYQRRCDNRESGGLWRLIDAYFNMDCARSDVIALEYQAKNHKRTVREANKVKRDAALGVLGNELAAACLKVVGVPRHD
jgi:hypothetical protein